jgi:hypothetical protein
MNELKMNQRISRRMEEELATRSASNSIMVRSAVWLPSPARQLADLSSDTRAGH